MKTLRGALALAGALTIAACSAQGGANPAIPIGSQPATTAATGHRANARQVCADAPPGYARCFALRRTDAFYATAPEYRSQPGIAPEIMESKAAQGFYGPLGPAQLQQAYALPSKDAGKGQTVGIVDAYEDPTAESDLAAYRAQFKLPPCTTANGCFRKLNQQGKAAPLPLRDAAWSGEISLDLDMVSAICPNCHIVLIEATSNSLRDLAKSVAAAHDAGAGQISNSYGGGECFVKNYYKVVCASPLPLAKYYDVPGTIITASSGDSQWFWGPQAPADFGTVVAVGGTSMYPYANDRGWFETAWAGAGSSCSKYVARPQWIPARTKCPGDTRPIADVSAIADPFTGVLVYQTFPNNKGGFYIYGGTSAASPIVAATYALAGNSKSLHYGSALYKAPPGSLNDVLVGKNGQIGATNIAGQRCVPTAICTAIPGWDGPTGNGTPSGVGAF